jgi:hypothetical protein
MKPEQTELIHTRASLNKNTSWLDSPGTWVTYLMVLLAIRFALAGITSIHSATAWTTWHCLHALVSFC